MRRPFVTLTVGAQRRRVRERRWIIAAGRADRATAAAARKCVTHAESRSRRLEERVAFVRRVLGAVVRQALGERSPSGRVATYTLEAFPDAPELRPWEVVDASRVAVSIWREFEGASYPVQTPLSEPGQTWTDPPAGAPLLLQVNVRASDWEIAAAMAAGRGAPTPEAPPG